MKIKIKDNDDKVIDEVEVDDEFGEWYVEQERKEENEARKYRYWVTTSLDGAKYEGDWHADPAPTPSEACIIAEEERRVNEFKKLLTATQLRRLELMLEDKSLREIARIENTNLSAIQKTRDQIRKKYEEFFGGQGGQND